MKTSIFNRLTRITPYLISAASLIFAAQFLFHTIQSSFHESNAFWFPFILFISVSTFIGLRDEFKFVRQIKLSLKDYLLPDLAKSMLVVISNVMITYFVALYFELSTIFAASFVCVISTYVLPNHQAEAYSGSCGGMIGAYLSGHWSIALLTGIMTALFYVLFKPYFLGVGGRGGSLPYSATILTIRLILDLNPEARTPIEQEFIVPSFFVIVLVTFLTYILHKYNILSVVRAAMFVSLVFSFLIPIDYYTMTTAMFTGTIVGMSVEERLDGYFHLFVVSIICSILFIPSFHILDGIGGKLGILCLISYYSSNGLKILVQVTQHYLYILSDKLST